MKTLDVRRADRNRAFVELSGTNQVTFRFRQSTFLHSNTHVKTAQFSHALCEHILHNRQPNVTVVNLLTAKSPYGVSITEIIKMTQQQQACNHSQQLRTRCRHPVNATKHMHRP